MAIKVLIVDDEPINVKLVEEILEYEEGFQSRTAPDGASAISMLNEYHPDIISGERIHDLVQKILLLSSLKNNRTLNLEQQSVSTYLQAIVNQKEHVSGKKCRIHVTCPNDFTLEVDWKLFHEAMSAVVNNGIKFTPPGQYRYYFCHM
jgi:signal transduction histidine kinase